MIPRGRGSHPLMQGNTEGMRNQTRVLCLCLPTHRCQSHTQSVHRGRQRKSGCSAHIRDFLIADADLQNRANFVDERHELFSEVGAERLGMSDGGLVHARFGELGEGAMVGSPRAGRLCAISDSGICPHVRRRRHAALKKAFDGGAQGAGRLSYNAASLSIANLGVATCSNSGVEILFNNPCSLLVRAATRPPLYFAAMQAISTL